ncbi:transposase [Acetobacter sp. AN02]|uniref:IS66 family insertion sequence element accessory protein TnpA n=1 Tax=Acetobacter sp. AN02 TaxID=2894186 RepID=UPI0024341C84|nr:transposase [Acetobacter sp. AN02]MDG6095245.1 transposase [Acetobacter sp. AN02]
MMDREALWRTRLTDFAESDQSQKAFCEERGYSPKALRQWARTLRFVPSREDISTAEPTVPEGRAEEFLCPTPAATSVTTRSWAELVNKGGVRRRWTDENRLALLQDALQSGLTLERYARLNHLTPSVLYRWYHQFSTQLQERPDAPLSREAAFADVQISDPVVTSPISNRPFARPNATFRSLEIVLNNGRTLRFPDGVGLDDAVCLVNALDTSP